LKKEKEENEVK